MRLALRALLTKTLLRLNSWRCRDAAAAAAAAAAGVAAAAAGSWSDPGLCVELARRMSCGVGRDETMTVMTTLKKKKKKRTRRRESAKKKGGHFSRLKELSHYSCSGIRRSCR